MNHGKLLQLILAIVACLVLTAGSVSAQDKSVRIAYVEWDCAAASTHVVQAALEEMGYEVEILPVAAAAMWQAVGTGNVDGMVTAWLPVTHADYYERVKNNVEDLGPIVGGAKLGWVVPSYVTIDSIEEMNDHADRFNRRIIGIDPGAGLMRLSEEAVEEYGLTRFTLVEGSDATMTAALSNAVDRNEWVVATAWSPHWKFGVWDLKYLDDPKGILGGEERIHTIVRKGLKEDKPEVYNFLNNFAWEDPNQLQMVMAWNQEPGSDRMENAKRFLRENKEQFESWKQ
ncbi:glycine betaine/proline transport system substrate-binding protein [Desulfonatronum thiosulfatophilum]|uniref:Glycine betaine/proline transport system substrate-binding protein n=1 Tax=Desulfonatronum thiosulfatophilum TaxID=617002 RepID=A0A1G6BPJ1_9BACT|nr:glycine betaine ABC transporter substrate-binding protein [Desulfonatronum thiosulfatophilum]SDB22510.1 glycine betaine/proline transport system substrate-binding protein [Desulfonatronum thiosulfatophilum]